MNWSAAVLRPDEFVISDHYTPSLKELPTRRRLRCGCNHVVGLIVSLGFT